MTRMTRMTRTTRTTRMTRMFVTSLALVASFACTQSSSTTPTTTTVAEAAPARGCGPAAACGEDAPAAGDAALTSVAPSAPTDVMEHEGGCGMHHAESEPTAAKPAGDPTVTAAFTSAPQPGAKAKCVVMDRDFVIENNTPMSTFNGKTYAFCCDGCKEMFDKDPAKFAALAEQHDRKQPHG